MKLKIKREVMYSNALVLYLIWADFILKVKWRENYFNIMTSIGRILMLIVLLILVYCVFRQKYTNKRLILTVGMLLCASITYFITWSNTIVFASLFIFGIRELDYLNLIKKYAIVQLLCIVGILVTYHFEMSVNVVTYWSYGFGISLGTYHANVFAMLVLSCYLGTCYSYLRDRIFWEFLLAFVVVVPLWFLTMSRTNCYLIILYPMAHAILLFFQKTRSTFMIKTLKYSLVMFLGVSLLLALFYQYIFHIISDGTFLARFIFGNELLKEYGISLFGNNIHFVSTNDSISLGVRAVILDSAYLRLLIYYGLISTVFIIYCFSKVMKDAVKAKNYVFLILCTIIALSGVTEAMMIEIEHNFAILAAFSCFIVENYNGIKNKSIKQVRQVY